MSDAFLPGNGFDTYETQDKVLVSMDGTVDCGVVVRILQQQGFGVAGTYLLGVDCRDISEYYPRQGSGYRCSFPMDIQLSGLFHFSCHV